MNHLYKCAGCGNKVLIELPISSDPKETFQCSECPSRLERKIGLLPKVNGLKVFAGDWYKKTYGQELGERDMERFERGKELEQMRLAEFNEGKNIPPC